MHDTSLVQYLSAWNAWREAEKPLRIVPLTLLRYNIRKHEAASLLGQLYFDPHPMELMLRNPGSAVEGVGMRVPLGELFRHEPTRRDLPHLGIIQRK